MSPSLLHPLRTIALLLPPLLMACPGSPSQSPTPADAITASTTPSPTLSPTPSPSSSATLAPSPSESPSPPPTERPSPSPTESPTLSPEEALCDDAPFVTYENFGAGFMLENCQPCHASTAPNRYGAPEGVTFDTLEEVRAFEERILARATGESASMPPGGGVSAEDRYLLEVWLRCYEG